ncbi:hypothetical protein IQ250_28460 [Pseudanabaenaceae cyanobacterium LEGE 13415]|nr:hypothetical protein [Pseudanabaenaceae cyanobacterium LEGE 13415]
MQLNLEQQAWAIRMMRDCCGVEISAEQLMVLLTLDPHLFADILIDMDTVAREHLMNPMPLAHETCSPSSLDFQVG